MIKFKIKVNSITTDNAPNIVLAAEKLLNEDESLPIKAIRCACHILNLVVQIGYDDASMSDCNRKIRYYCKRVHGSSLIKQFVSDQTILTKESDIKVELDITIRWNSTYDMIRTALRLPRALTTLSKHLVDENDSAELPLNDQDWETAKTTLFLLEPFNQGFLFLFDSIMSFLSLSKSIFILATKDLSGDYFGVIGQLNLVFMNIDDHLKECAASGDYKHLNSSILKMQKKFDEYWPKIKDDALACQLLYPRFKHSTFKSTSNKQNVRFLKDYFQKFIFYEFSGS